MKRLRKIYASVILSFLLVITSACGIPSTANAAAVQPMTVNFIDVGQGDSTLITCGGESMLIDAGDTDKGTTVQLYLKKQGVKALKYLVLTHPDSDHIGGAPVIITKFNIGSAYVSNFKKTTKTYDKVVQAFKYKSITPTTPKVGSQVTLGTATVTFLAPNRIYDTPNNSSIALLVQDGSKRFLFTGDAEEEAESDIVDTGINIKADVYQVGHHGSSTASSDKLLDAVQPTAAVISCGEGNKYGHPHSETLTKFRSRGIATYRTDEEGSIVAVTDGKTISWSVPASTTWQAGEKTESSTKTTAAAASKKSAKSSTKASSGTEYILNTNTKKFHLPTCSSVSKMSEKNKQESVESREQLISEGYQPCKICNP